MVPMADMLNARIGANNAKLFYEKDYLRMMATKAIPKGQQIWNTYGDPPNSELLRRYGHIDLVPLQAGSFGSPADVAEIRADVVVDVVTTSFGVERDICLERINWWLDEGGDDEFDFNSSCEPSEGFMSFVNMLLLDHDAWQRCVSKRKPPKSKIEGAAREVAIAVLSRRLQCYSTSISEDESLLTLAQTQAGAIGTNKRNAVAVRLSEKRILTETLTRCKELASETKVDRKRSSSSQIRDGQKRQRVR